MPAYRRRSVLCLALVALSACSVAKHPATPASTLPHAPPDALIDPDNIPRDFLWRQRLTATYGQHAYRFEAVLEKSGATLQVLFLTPYGTRALLLEQHHEEVRTEYFINERLPFPPEHILGDIHRAYFRGFDQASPESGTRRYREHGETFEDTWQNGRLTRRVARALGASPSRVAQPKQISITYTPGFSPGTAPARVALHNGWHGYEIVIETIVNE